MNVPRFCGGLALWILLLAAPLTGRAGELFPADFDDDGDIDFADFADFQTCALGPGVFQGDTVCTGALLDADDDVDFDDFEVFQGCLGGPDNPADLSCACASGETNCDGTCVSTTSDYANCGACGTTCGAGLTCQNGSCAACGGGATACSGVCTNVAFDPFNCGGCGIVCPDIETCSGGICQSPWRGAVVIPGDFDDDSDIDLADFAEFQTCALGSAIPQADPECTDARLDADQDVDLDDFEVLQGCLSGAENPANPNCACPSGQTNCDGTCTSTASDEANCGACGHACATGLVCQNGSCATCGEGTADCGGVCLDIWWDSTNCGGCGIVCPEQTSCGWGVCEGICIGCEP